ncbi:hypothetical protein AAFF_G00259620 [Aldrovandia affinis]|uniref:Uncharacterized protein n=1 Tax=Aldrovandia affinis TaxID=143900 RepID=A0AAD7W276_9TELE|nr:hypothetical protein AAFF_G00259620 [Aldrovandia affinis]
MRGSQLAAVHYSSYHGNQITDPKQGRPSRPSVLACGRLQEQLRLRAKAPQRTCTRHGLPLPGSQHTFGQDPTLRRGPELCLLLTQSSKCCLHSNRLLEISPALFM